jgi:hypothetical protein
MPILPDPEYPSPVCLRPRERFESDDLERELEF